MPLVTDRRRSAPEVASASWSDPISVSHAEPGPGRADAFDRAEGADPSNDPDDIAVGRGILRAAPRLPTRGRYPMSAPREQPRGTVLVVEDDRDIGAVVEQILTDEGFAVSLLESAGPASIRTAVARLEPDCILLDGESPRGYGASWADAAWIRTRDRAASVIMFTGHDAAIREAEEQRSVRSRGAGFAGILPKPFDLDQLIETVSRAVQSAR